jgi:pimeloyl-ACP methyl ester carboxylesterase
MTDQLVARRLPVPGATLHYEVRGAGPLLLVVGQPMTAEPFGPLADLLATDHTVVTYDPRGMGRSTVADLTEPVTPEVEADDLARLVEVCGGGPADVFGSSGGAVAGLALVRRRPELVRTLVAHEPPVTELLPDAVHVRAAVDAVADTYREHGGGAAWGGFISLVMHDGPVTADGVAPAGWQPPDAGAAGDDAGPSEEERAKREADDQVFFLRMLQPFTRYVPDTDALRALPARIAVGVGATSGDEIAKRSAIALAGRLGTPAVEFPGHHGGFMDDPEGFAAAVRSVLGTPDAG